MGESAFMIISSVWYEAMPRTIVEAYSRGTPIIASRIGALAELIEHGVTGRHFNPGDATDLAAQLQQALDHPGQTQSLRAHCRQRFESRYTAQTNLKQLIGLYQYAINAKDEKSYAI